MNYQTLLFDADETLLDFRKSETNALKNAFFAYNLTFTPQIEKLYTTINNSLWAKFELGLIDKNTVIYTRFQTLFTQLKINIDSIEFEDYYQGKLGEGAYLIEGARNLCKNLEQKFDLYIVSNGVSKTQHSRLKKSGLSNYMKQIFVSEDCGFQKPQKEFFDYVFSRIPNINLDATLIIGDSLTSDIQGGCNSGIDTCWYNPNYQNNPSHTPVTFQIHQLEELYTKLVPSLNTNKTMR